MSNLSFEEKSLWGQLISTGALGGYYFARVWGSWGQMSAGEIAALSLGLLAALIVVNIIYHAVIAIRTPPEPGDERDKLIARRAGNVAGWVLAVGSMSAVGHIVLGSLFQDDPGALYTRFATANILLLSMVLAQVTGNALQLLFYRRGV